MWKSGQEAHQRRVRDLGFPPLRPEERAHRARQFARVVRRWVLIFSDHEGTHGWPTDLEAAGLEHVRTAVWIKAGAAPQLTGDRPACGHECLVIAHQTRRGKPTRKCWNGGGKPGVYWHAIEADAHRCHPTPRPLARARSRLHRRGRAHVRSLRGQRHDRRRMRAARPGVSWLERDASMAELAEHRLAGLRAVPFPRQLEMFG